MALNAAQTRLYVVNDQADTIDVIDTSGNAILETIPVLPRGSVLPAALEKYKGANPNSVALSPDEKLLYATIGNLNAVAVIALGARDRGSRWLDSFRPVGTRPP